MGFFMVISWVFDGGWSQGKIGPWLSIETHGDLGIPHFRTPKRGPHHQSVYLSLSVRLFVYFILCLFLHLYLFLYLYLYPCRVLHVYPVSVSICNSICISTVSDLWFLVILYIHCMLSHRLLSYLIISYLSIYPLEFYIAMTAMDQWHIHLVRQYIPLNHADFP